MPSHYERIRGIKNDPPSLESARPPLLFHFKSCLCVLSQSSWCSRNCSRSSPGPVKTRESQLRARATEAHGLSYPKGRAGLQNVVQAKKRTKGDRQIRRPPTNSYECAPMRLYHSSVHNGFSHYTARETSIRPWTLLPQHPSSTIASCQEASLDVANIPDSASRTRTATTSFKQPATMVSKKA